MTSAWEFMRKYINILLGPLGYELTRLDRFASGFDQLLASSKGAKFVQVGANDGVSFDTLYAKVMQHRCAGLVIEPLPDKFALLAKNYAAHPLVTPVRFAVHASAESIDLFRVSVEGERQLPQWVSGIASFDRDHLVKHSVPDHFIVTERVPCTTLMSLLERHAYLDANILQIDTEGYDGEIIKMIDFQKFKPSLIKYEHKNLSTTEAADVKALLLKNGYRVYKSGSDTVAQRAHLDS